MNQVFNEEPEKVKVEAQIMPAGAGISALVKGEIDIQISTAKAYPRNIKTFKDKTLSLAKVNKEVARSCMYKLPRAGKMIDGESVRLAEIAATSWGNCRVAGRVIGIEEKHVHAQGAFIDLESNYAVTVDVFRNITDKNGKRYPEHMILTTAMAAVSIARRNAIIAGIPRSYINEMYKNIKAYVTDGQGRSLEDERTAAFKYLESKGISEKRILDLLGRGSIEDVTFNDIEDLFSLKNAVRDGMTTWQEAFPDLSNYANPKKVSGEDILKNTKAKASEKPPEKPDDATSTGKQEQKPSEPPKQAKQEPSESSLEQAEEPKRLTPKQKMVKLLLPIAKGNPAVFAKACEKALGGSPDMNIAPEVLLDNFTMKNLDAINSALKEKPSEPAPEEKPAAETSKPEDVSPETPKQQDLTPSEPSAPAEPEPEEAKPSEPEKAEDGDERAELIAKIKKHSAEPEEKHAIISDACSVSLDEAKELAENPERIESIENLRSISSILEMLA